LAQQFEVHPVSPADLAIIRLIDETAHGLSVCRQPDAARPTRLRGREGRPSARREADGEDGLSRHLPTTQHVEAGAGAQVYPYLLRKLAVTRPN
jgi:hypothetical protein